MSDNEIIKAETDNRREYVERIVNAVNYKGSGDHEDVWSILWEYQEENRDTINRQKAKIERLRKENKILSENADSAFQDGLNEAQDLYREHVKEEVFAEAIKKFAEKINARIAKAVASSAKEMADIATKPKLKRSDALVLSNLVCRISTANMVSTLVDKLAKEEVGDNNGDIL